MRLKLLTLASAVSLLVCIAAAALWVRSCYVYNAGPFPAEGATVQFDSLNGELAVIWRANFPGAGAPVHIFWGDAAPPTALEQQRIYRHDILGWDCPDYWWTVQHRPKWLHVSVDRPPPPDCRNPIWMHLDRTQLDGRGRDLGVGFRHAALVFEPSKATVQFQTLIAPYWLLVTLTGLLPVCTLVSWRRRRNRIGRNQCSHCGYDLRASPDRCPECGTPVTKKQGATA